MARMNRNTLKNVLIGVLVLGIAWLLLGKVKEGFQDKVVEQIVTASATPISWPSGKSIPAGATTLKEIKISGITTDNKLIQADPKLLGANEDTKIRFVRADNKEFYSKEYRDSVLPSRQTMFNKQVVLPTLTSNLGGTKFTINNATLTKLKNTNNKQFKDLNLKAKDNLKIEYVFE